MKKRLFAVVFVFCTLLLDACSSPVTPAPTNIPTSAPTETPAPTATSAPTFVLSSPAFANGEAIPTVYTCNGDRFSPELVWTEPPAGTKSFALIMDDPDAGGYVHWVIFNIPAESRGLPEKMKSGQELDGGIYQGLSGGAVFGYVGPCPPALHHYSLRLYALDTVFTKEQGAGKKLLEDSMQGHILAQTELTGTFKP